MSYKQVIDLLTETRDKIGQLLTEKIDEHHRLKLQSDMQRNITYLSLLTNTTATNVQTEMPTFGPAKTIAGKPIPTKDQVSREQLEPNEEKVRVLREKVDRMYADFLTIPTIDIVRHYEENVIRGVAKKAKMKVTKDDPETITVAFVDEIKKNIQFMEQRNQENEQKKQQQQQPDLKNPDADEIQQGTQADVNDKGAAAAEELPSPSEIREATTNTPNVAKTPPSETDEQPKTNRRNR